MSASFTILAAEIRDALAVAFDVPAAEIASACRARRLARPRQIGMWVMHRAGTSKRRVAREFGRDRETVLHAVRRVDALRRTDRDIRRVSDDLLARFTDPQVRARLADVQAFEHLVEAIAGILVNGAGTRAMEISS